MLPSVHDHQGAPKSQFKFSATFYGEEEETEVILKGHKVVGTSYTGTLPCTGLTLWYSQSILFRCSSSGCLVLNNINIEILPNSKLLPNSFCFCRPVADLCANFIASRSDGFKGKRVLEVGCGLGLCGIIAGTS